MLVCFLPTGASDEQIAASSRGLPIPIKSRASGGMASGTKLYCGLLHAQYRSSLRERLTEALRS
jgi:hypothetical protein